jgi:hypothetical protein
VETIAKTALSIMDATIGTAKFATDRTPAWVA